MIKKNHILFLLVIIAGLSVAQVDSVYYGDNPSQKRMKQRSQRNSDLRERLMYGGNFAVWFGNYTYINLSPTIGYRLTDKMQVGIGGIYNYSSYRYKNAHYFQNIYGSHVFARYLVYDYLFVQGQYDRLNQPNYLLYNYKDQRVWVDYVMVGGGLRQPLGKHAAAMTTIMFNLTPSPLSVYSNPYVQIGIMAGF